MAGFVPCPLVTVGLYSATTSHDSGWPHEHVAPCRLCRAPTACSVLSPCEMHLTEVAKWRDRLGSRISLHCFPGGDGAGQNEAYEIQFLGLPGGGRLAHICFYSKWSCYPTQLGRIPSIYARSRSIQFSHQR